MNRKIIVGLAGSYHRPSRTQVLVGNICSRAEQQYGLTTSLHDMADFGASLGQAMHFQDLDDKAQVLINKIIASDALVIGVPTYQASYPGMFKHLFDLIDPEALVGKPMILAATGGSERHAMMVEYQLRPLFKFFRASTVPTAIYVTANDGEHNPLANRALLNRVDRAIQELSLWFG
ncbi:FMN reductase, MsuE subfamily [Xenorhabdus bovienii str. oregonense]|uniref:FMN reductase, MsuE subfamily n=1 Tax=Xenorhabdus bovienii str. oregonense TaxID=1398202 RepID=A0A077P8U3_XENBV|nr:NAD(P)H-dependent oxidoreductase [Xenorhabdus bovienii]CDH07249.1 FMN reductase, MsuE subfamily [Xenorhabdus bovienii str. oregonense]